MIQGKIETDQFIVKYLNAKTHWCIIPGIDACIDIVIPLEQKFYTGKPKHFIAILYPYKGSLIQIYLADKADLSADDFWQMCKDGGTTTPREAFAKRDIVFLGTHEEMELAVDMMIELDKDRVLLSDVIE